MLNKLIAKGLKKEHAEILLRHGALRFIEGENTEYSTEWEYYLKDDKLSAKCNKEKWVMLGGRLR